MFKIILLTMSVFLLLGASDYSRANKAAKEAHIELDCDFDDCPKPALEPKVIVQEKIVEVEKEVVVEKIVYVDRPAPEVVAAPVAQEPKSEPSAVVVGRIYNKAFFDVHPASQAPMLDYITYTNRASFNIEQFVDTVKKIKENGAKAYIHGSLAVPDSITTDEVYMSVGTNYLKQHYNGWKKEITYNNSTTAQNSDFFLVNVKKDMDGNRYVDYRIYLFLYRPWNVTAAEEEFAPNTFFFKMAPKTRGFKNQFVVAQPYIIEE